MNHKYVIALLSVGIFFIYGCNVDTNATKDVEALQKAPDFSLTTMGGKTITRDDFNGKIVLVQAYAAWCPTCQIEARNIQEVRNRFSEDELEIIHFNVQPGESKEQIEEFRKKSLGDGGNWYWALPNSDAAYGFSVRSLEQTYLINNHGEIAYMDIQFTNPDAISKIIKEMI
jgi:thiol-disulfide isomerase/thioredoxin